MSDLVLLVAGTGPAFSPMALRSALRRAAKNGASLIGIGPGRDLLSDLDLAAPCRLPHSAAGRDARTGIGGSGQALLLAPQGPPLRGPAATILLDWLARHVSPAEAERAAARLGLVQQAAPAGESEPGAIRALMLAHLADPLPLPVLAAALGLSPKRMRSRCLRETGETPARLYAALRLDDARALAETTRLPVPDLARQAGFASASSFTRAYRLRFGAPPRGPKRAQA